MQFEIPSPYPRPSMFRWMMARKSGCGGTAIRTACGFWSRTATASPPMPTIRIGGSFCPNLTCWCSIFAIMDRTCRWCRRTTTTSRLVRDLERVVQAVKTKLGRERKTAGIFHSMSARSAMKPRGRGRLALGCVDAVRSAGCAAEIAIRFMPSMEVFENKLTEWAKGRRRQFNNGR